MPSPVADLLRDLAAALAAQHPPCVATYTVLTLSALE